DADRILDETPSVGSLAEISPRIDARLLPLDGSTKLSAKTLSELISLTQSIVQYAGYDVYHGINPHFADLRSLSAALVSLTKLSIEPFEEGSFVIPARLEANPLAIEDTQPSRQVTAEDVVKRFNEILASLQDPSSAVQVSIGAIQTVEALGRVIRREAEAIEFSSFDILGQPRQSLRVDEDYIDRVHKVRESRRPTRAALETLEGTLTALDLVRATLQLSLDDRRIRIQGSYPMLFQPSLVNCLGKRVRIQGQVERHGRGIRSVLVLSVESLEEEA